MKTITNILINSRPKRLQLMLALALGGLCCGASVMAQDVPANPKIAVLDMGRALFDSDIAKKVEEELRTETAEDAEKIRTLEQEAVALQEKLQKDTAVMSEAEQRKANEQLQEIGVQYQYLAEKLQTLTEQRRQQFQETYSPNLVEAIQAIVAEEKYDLVYRAEAVLFFQPAYDITARVTERLNSQNQ